MNLTSIIDLIAGMIFIYFILSLVCNSIFEAVSSMRDFRAQMLEKWISKNLPGLAFKFYDHTLINGLSDKGKTTSYISAQNFTTAFLEIISSYTKSQAVPEDLQGVIQMLDDLKNDPDPAKSKLIPQDLERTLRLFVAQARSARTGAATVDQLQLFRTSIENWFDSMMERLTGNYKRKARKWTGWIAAGIAIGLNINSITLIQYLSADDAARGNLAQAAYKAADDSHYKNMVDSIKVNNTVETDSTTRKVNADSTITVITTKIKHADTLVNALSALIPLGWTGKEFATFKNQYGWDKDAGIISWACAVFLLFSFLGWVVTIFAISLGAPFWYDLLSKIADLRSSVKPATAAEQKDNSDPS